MWYVDPHDRWMSSYKITALMLPPRQSRRHHHSREKWFETIATLNTAKRTVQKAKIALPKKSLIFELQLKRFATSKYSERILNSSRSGFNIGPWKTFWQARDTSSVSNANTQNIHIDQESILPANKIQFCCVYYLKLSALFFDDDDDEKVPHKQCSSVQITLGLQQQFVKLHFLRA